MKTLSLSSLSLSATLFACCTSILSGCSGAADEEFNDDPSSTSDAIKTSKDAGVVVVDVAPTGVYDMTIGLALQSESIVVLGQSKRSPTNPQIEASLVRLGAPLLVDGFE